MSAAESEAVLEANQAFYDAFEARDIDAMSELWEHTDRVVCTHPGSPTLRGWGLNAGSWYVLFTNNEHLQFIVTNAKGEVDGDITWSCATRTSSAVRAAARWPRSTSSRAGQGGAG